MLSWNGNWVFNRTCFWQQRMCEKLFLSDRLWQAAEGLDERPTPDSRVIVMNSHPLSQRVLSPEPSSHVGWLIGGVVTRLSTATIQYVSSSLLEFFASHQLFVFFSFLSSFIVWLMFSPSRLKSLCVSGSRFLLFISRRMSVCVCARVLFCSLCLDLTFGFSGCCLWNWILNFHLSLCWLCLPRVRVLHTCDPPLENFCEVV